MKINHQVVVFDAAELEPESRFWAGVLGGEVESDEHDDWHMIVVDGEPRMGIQLAPDHVRPEWPNGEPQQIHLDLWVDDVDSAHAEVMALGATTAPAGDRRGLPRRLPGVRGSGRPPVLPLLDQPLIDAEDGAMKIDAQALATAAEDGRLSGVVRSTPVRSGCTSLLTATRTARWPSRRPPAPGSPWPAAARS